VRMRVVVLLTWLGGWSGAIDPMQSHTLTPLMMFMTPIRRCDSF